MDHIADKFLPFEVLTSNYADNYWFISGCCREKISEELYRGHHVTLPPDLQATLTNIASFCVLMDATYPSPIGFDSSL